jgi:hypothetical protein
MLARKNGVRDGICPPEFKAAFTKDGQTSPLSLALAES